MLLAALACLAGLAMAVLKTSPSGPAAPVPQAGSTQAAGGCVLIAAWHKAGGHNTLIVAATFGQPGTAQTIPPNALDAGHVLVLALDRALGHRGR